MYNRLSNDTIKKIEEQFSGATVAVLDKLSPEQMKALSPKTVSENFSTVITKLSNKHR